MGVPFFVDIGLVFPAPIEIARDCTVMVKRIQE